MHSKVFWVFFSVALVSLAPACYTKPFDVDVTGSIKMAYDDNISYATTNRLSDFVTNLQTGLAILQQGEAHQLSLQTDVIEQIFVDHSNFDNTSEDLKFDYKQDFSEYDHLELKENLTHSYEPTSFEDAFGRSTGRYSTLNNQAGFSYTHNFTGQVSSEVHYVNTVNDYSQNGPVNSILHQAGTKVSYAWDTANIFNATYDYFRRIFAKAPSATINSLLTGARHYFTPQLFADLGAGPDFISSFNGKNYIKPHYMAALTDQVDANNRVSLTFEKQDTTDNYTEDLFNSWRTALNFYKQLSQRLSTFISVFYGQGRYNDLRVHENLTGVQTQLNYAITPKTSLAVGYTYSDSLSNSSNYGYQKNYVYFSVTIKF
ncbi:MAG: outer membrane beta-barrel protein [Candidatus Omnitrophica bacterium]|nr:outer membrane beta-barrel protein [Candidatus Omnitrophota bacterium]